MAIGIERMEGRRLFRARWLPLIVYVVIIFALSAVPGLGVPGTFVYRDKLAHLVEYGGLGWLVHRAARDTWPTAPGLRRALLGILAVSLLGACDELFQAGVPGRDSSVVDWAADTLGVSITQVVGVLREKRGGGA